MIRAILVVGWLGLALMAVAAWTGYAAHDEESARQHMVVSLFPTAALLFADLCVLVYMPGTARVVRRTTTELAIGGDWTAEQARLARRGGGLAGAATLATGALFGSGFPAFSGLWPAWIHHALFVAVAVLQLLLLTLGGRLLGAGENRLRALGEIVERRREPGIS